MNIILSVFSVSVILIVSLIGVGVFKAFKAFMGALDNFVEKYVPKKDSITVEITKELVESFAEEFGYVVVDYDKLMKIIRRNLTSSGFMPSSFSNCNVGGFFTDIMIQIFSIATEEHVVFNTLENTFSVMLNKSAGEEEEEGELKTNTVFEEEPGEYKDKVNECLKQREKVYDHLKENQVKAESGKSEIDKKMLLRRGK